MPLQITRKDTSRTRTQSARGGGWMERVVLRWGDSVTGAHSLSLSLRVRFCWSPTGIIFERSEGTEKKDQHTQKWTHHFDCGVCCVTVSKALLLSLRGDNQIDIVTLETDARTHRKKKEAHKAFFFILRTPLCWRAPRFHGRLNAGPNWRTFQFA